MTARKAPDDAGEGAKPPRKRAKPAVKGAAPAKATPAKRAPRRRPPVSMAKRLTDDLTKPDDPVTMTLRIRQAARCAERLDQLAALLNGDADAWVKVSIPRSDAGRGRVYVEVKVDDLVREERAQSKLLRELLDGISRARGEDGGDGKPKRPPGKDVLDLD